MIKEGKLTPSGGNKKVAYHDPCYLGRHSEIYDKPREILEATGAEKVDMNREQAFALCCGGGGGRLWMETLPEQRFSDLRVKEAKEAGAEVLATACPYCISMLTDSLKSTDLEDVLEVKELSELLLEVC